MVSFRKRTYGGYPRKTRNVKRRIMKRRVRRPRRTSKQTYATKGSGLAPVKRRFNRRAYRGMLYRNTQHMTHYMSRYATYNTIATPSALTTGTAVVYTAITNAFWTSGGGTLAADVGDAVAAFTNTGGLVIRGGKIYLHLSCENAETIRYEVVLVSHIVGEGSIVAAPLFNTSQLTNIDADDNIGKVMKVWSGYMESGIGAIMFEYRLKPRKVNKVDWSDAAFRPYWIVSVWNTNTVGAATVAVLYGHELSFCGDVSV